MSMTLQFRSAVMGEFRIFCEKSPGAIDLEMLTALITEFSGEPIRSTTVPDSVKVPKAKKTKRVKKSEESCDFCRMPEPNPDKCMSRSFGKGFGTQCTRKSKVGDYCGMHAKQLSESGDPPLGRIDEPRHLTKRGEETNECGWKHFRDDGSGVEDTSEEAVGVGANEDIQSVVGENVVAFQESSDEEDTDVVLDADPPGPVTVHEAAAPETAPEVAAPETVLEAVPESAVSVPESVVSVPETAASVPEAAASVPEAAASVPESVVKVPDSSPEAKADAPAAPVPETKADAPAAPVPEAKTDAVPVEKVPEVNQESSVKSAVSPTDSDTEEDTEEEEDSTRREGVFQGVEYVFDTSGDECIIQKFNKKTYKLKDVGIYDEAHEQVTFNKEYQHLHDEKVTNEEQQEVEWK
jgi:hypothetical protein